MTPNQRLGRKQRLTQSSLFRQTYDQGRKQVGRYMVLWLRHADDASLRLGVVTGRKVGNAVERARARRRLREAYRRNRSRLSGPFDVVLVGRRAILQAEWQEVVLDLMNLVRRAGLLKSDDSERA